MRDAGSFLPFGIDRGTLSIKGKGEPTGSNHRSSETSAKLSSAGPVSFPLRDMGDKNTIGHFTARMTFKENTTGIDTPLSMCYVANTCACLKPQICFGLEARNWQKLARQNLLVWTD